MGFVVYRNIYYYVTRPLINLEILMIFKIKSLKNPWMRIRLRKILVTMVRVTRRQMLSSLIRFTIQMTVFMIQVENPQDETFDAFVQEEND